jgi:hypothetical protein
MRSTMNSRRIPKLRINEKMIEGFHYEIYKSPTDGVGSIKGCVMMSVDFAPPGGLTDEEIKAIKDYVVNDSTNDYYAIGLETTDLVDDNGDKARHMHIRLVKSEQTVVAKQKLVFHPFLAKGRCVWKDDNKNKTCISLNIEMCKEKYRNTNTPAKQMAYAMKESMGEYNNGETHWCNLLDGFDGSAQWIRDKKIFDATVKKAKKKKEKRGEYRISNEAQVPMAKEYAQVNGLQWSMDNHLEILATMLTDTSGSKEYTLGNDYGLKAKVRQLLPKFKGQDNYKEMYLKALQQHAASIANALGVNILTKKEKNLTLENEKLMKKNAKLTKICEGHVVTIEKLKRQIKETQVSGRKRQRVEKEVPLKWKDTDCNKCGSTVTSDAITLKCGHLFHAACLRSWVHCGNKYCFCRETEIPLSLIGVGTPLKRARASGDKDEERLKRLKAVESRM